MIKFKRNFWFKLNRSLHRDVGYFSIGLTIVFAISGLALNHIRDFNPNYQVTRIEKPVQIDVELKDELIIKNLLKNFDLKRAVKASYWESKHVFKLFFDEGHTLTFHSGQQKALFEMIEARPILPHFNRLHLNEAKHGWIVFSDIYAICLLYLAISALFMVRGKHRALGRRRGWLIALGALVPTLYIFI
ncbi:MAG: PepSY-associated TM helix domain-containing protein [Pseudomonadota bacterium]